PNNVSRFRIASPHSPALYPMVKAPVGLGVSAITTMPISITSMSVRTGRPPPVLVEQASTGPAIAVIVVAPVVAEAVVCRPLAAVVVVAPAVGGFAQHLRHRCRAYRRVGQQERKVNVVPEMTYKERR